MSRECEKKDYKHEQDEDRPLTLMHLRIHRTASYERSYLSIYDKVDRALKAFFCAAPSSSIDMYASPFSVPSSNSCYQIAHSVTYWHGTIFLHSVKDSVINVRILACLTRLVGQAEFHAFLRLLQMDCGKAWAVSQAILPLGLDILIEIICPMSKTTAIHCLYQYGTKIRLCSRLVIIKVAKVGSRGRMEVGLGSLKPQQEHSNESLCLVSANHTILHESSKNHKVITGWKECL